MGRCKDCGRSIEFVDVFGGGKMPVEALPVKIRVDPDGREVGYTPDLEAVRGELVPPEISARSGERIERVWLPHRNWCSGRVRGPGVVAVANGGQ